MGVVLFRRGIFREVGPRGGYVTYPMMHVMYLSIILRDDRWLNSQFFYLQSHPSLWSSQNPLPGCALLQSISLTTSNKSNLTLPVFYSASYKIGINYCWVRTAVGSQCTGKETLSSKTSNELLLAQALITLYHSITILIWVSHFKGKNMACRFTSKDIMNHVEVKKS